MTYHDTQPQSNAGHTDENAQPTTKQTAPRGQPQRNPSQEYTPSTDNKPADARAVHDDDLRAVYQFLRHEHDSTYVKSRHIAAGADVSRSVAGRCVAVLARDGACPLDIEAWTEPKTTPMTWRVTDDTGERESESESETEAGPELVTDGGQLGIEPDAWYVLDDHRDVVVAGPVDEERALASAAAAGTETHIAVSGRALAQRGETTTLGWETGDVRKVTDGGTDCACEAERDSDGEWDPEPVELREGETVDGDAHARRNAEQLRMLERHAEQERGER